MNGIDSNVLDYTHTRVPTVAPGYADIVARSVRVQSLQRARATNGAIRFR